MVIATGTLMGLLPSEDDIVRSPAVMAPPKVTVPAVVILKAPGLAMLPFNDTDPVPLSLIVRFCEDVAITEPNVIPAVPLSARSIPAALSVTVPA